MAKCICVLWPHSKPSGYRGLEQKLEKSSLAAELLVLMLHVILVMTFKINHCCIFSSTLDSLCLVHYGTLVLQLPFIAREMHPSNMFISSGQKGEWGGVMGSIWYIITITLLS
jgi:hypothetical protein